MDNRTFEKLLIDALALAIKGKDVSSYSEELLNIIKNDPPEIIKLYNENEKLVQTMGWTKYNKDAVILAIQRHSFGAAWSAFDYMCNTAKVITVKTKLQCNV